MPRLLWRGSLILPAPYANDATTCELHGVAVIASSFNVDGLSSNKTSTDANDPFSEDVADSASLRSYRGAIQELCLDLEMTRNRPLPVYKTAVKLRSERDVHVSTKDALQEPLDTTAAPRKLHGRKALKANIDVLRKGKSKSLMSAADNDEENVVYLHHASLASDHSQDPLLYIDPRCTETVNWFERQFCNEEVDTARNTTSKAVLIDISSDSLSGDVTAGRFAVYGRLQTDQHSTRNRLQLYVGRLRNKRDLLPRPDAPAPRENLFAQRLRRSASMQDVRNLHSSQALVETNPESECAKKVDKSSLKPKQGLLRSQSTSAISGLANNRATEAPHPAVPKGPNILKRKPSTSASQKPPNPLKRSRLTSSVLDRLQEEGENAEDAEKADNEDISDIRIARDASPTASIASRHSTASRSANVTHPHLHATSRRISHPPGSNLTRSLSMPPAQQPKQSSEQHSKPKRPPRALSVAASDAGTDLLGADDILITAITSRNKPILRKAVIAHMRDRRCNKDHPDHEIIFATTYRGVQCQMRERFSTQLLQEQDLSSSIIAHLGLYVPLVALVPTATPVHSCNALYNVASLD